MLLEHYEAMARYNHWMNDKLYALCAELPDEERKRDMGAFFGSIHRTLRRTLAARSLRCLLTRMSALRELLATETPSHSASKPICHFCSRF